MMFVVLLLPLLVGATPLYQYHPKDCSDVYNNGQTLSGVYTIYPTETSPVQVYCDMGCTGSSSEIGKWTVIQRRMDGSVNFYRPWEHYKKGFGNSDGEYWLGLENMHLLTQKKKYELRVDLQDFEGVSVYAQYSTFSVGSEESGYKLEVSGFINGGAGDSLSSISGQRFTTLDKDQDTYELNCARSFLAAFWYTSCHSANPNGIYLWGKDGTHYAIGNVWAAWKGHDYGLKSISMKIRPVM